MTKILITGFDPFDKATINPAFEAVKRLPDKIAGAEIIKLEIPTVFGKSVDKTIAKMREVKPDVVINVGQAGGRFDVTPERVAINVDDARIADNESKQPLNKAIEPNGQPAYFATLPVKAMVEAMKEVGIPASLSNTAGTFVCNHVMYGVLHACATEKEFSDIRAGFIHVPYMTEQVVHLPNTASLSLETIAKALEVAIVAVVKSKEDIEVVAGQTH